MYTKIKALFLLLSLLMVPLKAGAEDLSSTNYRIENSTIDAGGESSSSTNYTERESIGGPNDSSESSTNYSIFPGFMQHAYPGVPGQPTLTNTGGSLYNALDFVIDPAVNQDDTTYAIAISPDAFASTTYFIQSDLTIGVSAYFQDYTGWGGGSGGRVTGLDAGTTYTIKVKARFGPDTETGYSLTDDATTASGTFTLTIAGVNSGTSVAGQTTTITTSATAISYGSLVPDTPSVAAQTVTVTTNALAGYVATLQQDDDLHKSNGNTIAPIAYSNASPGSFPSSVSTGVFGYHTTDSSLCTGTSGRFSSNDTYAAATTAASEIACDTAPVTTQQTFIVYKVLIGTLQQSGAYQNTITYRAYGQF